MHLYIQKPLCKCQVPCGKIASFKGGRTIWPNRIEKNGSFYEVPNKLMSTDPETKKIRDVNEGGRFQNLIVTKKIEFKIRC